MVMTAPFRLIISPDIWGDQVVSNDYPIYHRFKVSITQPQLIKTKEASFSIQSFAGMDYFFELWTFSTSKTGSVSMKVEQAFIALVVCLKVDRRPFSDNIEEVNGKKYSLCYFPKGTYNIHLAKGDTVLAMVVPPLYHLHSMAIEHQAIKEMYTHLLFNGIKEVFLDEQSMSKSVLRIIILLQQSREQGASLDHAIRGYILQLLSQFNKQVRIAEGVVHHIPAGRRKMHQIIKYIHDHLTDEKLDETGLMAKFFKINVTFMRKEFKLATGKTIEHYIRDERLVYAKQLLEQTELPVFEVAHMVGYSATSNFIRAYKKLFGISPGGGK